ncbi:MAG: hypothetical protein J6Z50_08815, partial [Fibrobacterales bacterium]|nr:hypothetical protein [Fibrobacterales bacterium]
MKASFGKILGALAVAFALSAPSFAAVNISWVPPYGYSASQSAVQNSWTYNGKSWGVKDGLTYLNLQWWKPADDGTLSSESYGRDSTKIK